VLRWLQQPGVRLVEIDGEWTCPTGGAERHREWVSATYDASEPFRDRRGLRPSHRPARALGSTA
jgi:DNA polymerase-3 subunit epsilon